jgi:hypothetical protein
LCSQNSGYLSIATIIAPVSDISLFFLLYAQRVGYVGGLPNVIHNAMYKFGNSTK